MPTTDDLKAATGTGLALSGGGALASQRRGVSSRKVTGRWADDCKDREKYMDEKYMESEPLIEAINDTSRLIVLSPHLDDAVLSCGALMNHARTETSVTVVTFFTEGGPPPYTYGARRYLHKTRDRHANSLFLVRRAEDQAALEGAGISYVHVGLKEILFRRRTQPLLSRFPWANRLIPELSYAYPTLHLHVLRGGISPDDLGTIRSVLDTMDDLSLESSTLFLAPLGVGGHKDHILVRTAAELSRKRVTYYSDFPYNTRHSVDQSFVQRNSLMQTTWSRDVAAKLPLIRAYRSQVDALFPAGKIPVVPETYLLPKQQKSL
jgi:LmbE family N-acetylglucosaminyl deacetylase